jgi:hypothetical protein
VDTKLPPRMWIWIGVPDARALHEKYVTSGAKIRNPFCGFHRQSWNDVTRTRRFSYER